MWTGMMYDSASCVDWPGGRSRDTPAGYVQGGCLLVNNLLCLALFGKTGNPYGKHLFETLRHFLRKLGPFRTIRSLTKSRITLSDDYLEQTLHWKGIIFWWFFGSRDVFSRVLVNRRVLLCVKRKRIRQRVCKGKLVTIGQSIWIAYVSGTPEVNRQPRRTW